MASDEPLRLLDLASDPVLAATRWVDNAHMIEDAARLGYLYRARIERDAREA